jgi:hypothetical protein
MSRNFRAEVKILHNLVKDHEYLANGKVKLDCIIYPVDMCMILDLFGQKKFCDEIPSNILKIYRPEEKASDLFQDIFLYSVDDSVLYKMALFHLVAHTTLSEPQCIKWRDDKKAKEKKVYIDNLILFIIVIADKIAHAGR